MTETRIARGAPRDRVEGSIWQMLGRWVSRRKDRRWGSQGMLPCITKNLISELCITDVETVLTNLPALAWPRLLLLVDGRVALLDRMHGRVFVPVTASLPAVPRRWLALRGAYELRLSAWHWHFLVTSSEQSDLERHSGSVLFNRSLPSVWALTI